MRRGAAMSDYDVLVIGSGFGGSVTALRLTEKGYRVGVLEAGRRFTPETLPKTSWRGRGYPWAPEPGRTRLQRVHPLKGALVLGGGRGGGGPPDYAHNPPLPPPPVLPG